MSKSTLPEEKTFWIVNPGFDQPAPCFCVIYQSERDCERETDNLYPAKEDGSWVWENFHGKVMTLIQITDAVSNDDKFYSAKALLQHAELYDDDRAMIEQALQLSDDELEQIYS